MSIFPRFLAILLFFISTAFDLVGGISSLDQPLRKFAVSDGRTFNRVVISDENAVVVGYCDRSDEAGPTTYSLFDQDNSKVLIARVETVNPGWFSSCFSFSVLDPKKERVLGILDISSGMNNTSYRYFMPDGQLYFSSPNLITQNTEHYWMGRDIFSKSFFDIKLFSLVTFAEVFESYPELWPQYVLIEALNAFRSKLLKAHL